MKGRTIAVALVSLLLAGAIWYGRDAATKNSSALPYKHIPRLLDGVSLIRLNAAGEREVRVISSETSGLMTDLTEAERGLVIEALLIKC